VPKRKKKDISPLSFRNEGEIKMFLGKQRVHHHHMFYKKARENSSSEKKGC
jgi:hypothetical protein